MAQLSIDQLIRQRRTISDFEPNVIPDKQLILDAIELSQWVPNHHLSQPWHYYWPSKNQVDEIIDLNTALVAQTKDSQTANKKHARWSQIPGWLILTCQKSDDPIRQQEDYAACCAAAYVLSLSLYEKNVGTKWTTGPVIREADFYRINWIDQEKETVVGLIWYGTIAKTPKPQSRLGINHILTDFTGSAPD